MLGVLFGAASAVFFGAGDFVGGFASKRITAMLVTGIAALAGVAALTFAAPFDGGIWHAETWIGGIGTGVTSCLGIWLLYSAYSVGPMTTLAPIVAIVSTVVPMAAGLLAGETFSALGWVAVAVGIVAIGLVAAAPDARTSKARPIDAVKAALAGAFLGVFYIYLDGGLGNVHVDEAGLTPLMANRITCVVIAFSAVAVLALRRRPIIVDDRAADPRSGAAAPQLYGVSSRGAAVVDPRPASAQAGRTATLAAAREPAAQRPGATDRARRIVLISAVALAMLSGTLDATANALFTFGLAFGDLAVLSVVSGFYPAVTIGLAFVLLRERPNRLQGIGITLSLVSLVGMSLA
ncbi:MAG: EamA family transporter [Leucobacter sp.]